ncbi:zinc finger protein 660 [Spodoptera frugiperda]|uniref:Zinc finger protein 660 n=1 Tax=Spodoptera frugiperda TaxID=7108 RepID=A0A9R0D5M8_SPOFR|nr:zinc finger protein 660 [Spodoptera frugiperda]
MNPQVCTNCCNEKPVNATDNRLVTESCGHVKCMDCLLHEKTGCQACLSEKSSLRVEEGLNESLDEEFAEDSPLPETDKCYDELDKEVQSEVYDEFYKKKKLETSHIKVETDANGKTFLCTVCKKKFHAPSQVAYHAYCNGQRKPYQCPECNKTFATMSHYKYHMRVHRNERTYSCDVCGEGFFQMSKLQRHKLKHTKEKKFACNECNKAFNNLSSLRKHGLTHTDERPFSCPTCGTRFRDSSNLRKHNMRKHERKCACGGWGGCVRPGCSGGDGGGGAAGRSASRRTYQCPRCPRAFHSGKDMRRHAAVHTDSKPFRCKVCSRRFRRKDNLERHIRNTHPEYVPATAVDCDETILKQIQANGHSTKLDDYQKDEKFKLKIMNPLPPLPDELMQKHMHETDKKQENADEDEKIDKSYILVANNARQSVIVGNKTATVEKTVANSPEHCEYVHKIRKASIIPLPPIDVRKMIELEEQTNLNNLDLGTPPKDKKTLYEKILYGDRDKKDSEEPNVDSGPEVHWRRKLKQSVSIDI